MAKGFRKGSLVGMWLDLKENGSPSDFPSILANVQYKLLIKAFKGVMSPWRTYTRVTTCQDFKSNNRTWLSEVGDLIKKNPGGGYQARIIKDYNYQIQLATFGEAFQLLRETIINDDLNAFQQLPTIFGRAAGRTIAKQVANILETNPNAYDGSPLIRSTNSSSTALTADTNGISALQAGVKAIMTSTDPNTGEIMGLTAKYLVVSPALAEVGKWLLSSKALIGSTSALQDNPLLDPALSGRLILLIDPFLVAFPNRWYLLADPNDAHAIEVALLEGSTEPAMLMKDPDAKLVGGAEDPWGYYYDDLEYKIRWDWGLQAAFYQAIYKGGS